MRGLKQSIATIYQLHVGNDGCKEGGRLEFERYCFVVRSYFRSYVNFSKSDLYLVNEVPNGKELLGL